VPSEGVSKHSTLGPLFIVNVAYTMSSPAFLHPARPPRLRSNAAFLSPLCASFSRPHSSIRHPRASSRRPVLSASAANQPSSAQSPDRPRKRRVIAKQHAAASLRCLSDTGAVVLLHELISGALVGRVGGLVEASVALGGLAGVWTAAYACAALRKHAASAARAARDIADSWDRHFLYGAGSEFHASGDGIEADDVHAVVAWLHALEELETPAGAALLWELSASSSPAKRLAVAEALGDLCTLQSNILRGVIVALADDDAEAVSTAANNALLLLDPHSDTTLSSSPLTTAADADDFNSFIAARDRAVRAQLEAVLKDGAVREEKELHRQLKSRFQQHETKAAAATIAATPDEHVEPACSIDVVVTKRLWKALEVQAPLFDWLGNTELRLMCLALSAPLASELFHLGLGETGLSDMSPLRFIGLGWLMAVGGLVCYPQSGALWNMVDETAGSHISSRPPM
jgi:hypothetical protein